MAVRLRLMRLGRKKKPFYRIVAVDSRSRRDGAYLDKLGHYNPLTRPPEIALDEDKALEWLNKGAQPSDTVRSLLSKRGVMLKYDLIRKGASEEKISEELKKLEIIRKAQKEEATIKSEVAEGVMPPEGETAKVEVETSPAETAAENEKPQPLTVEPAPAEEESSAKTEASEQASGEEALPSGE